MTTTTHRIRTGSTAAFLVAGLASDGTVYRIGYAHSHEAAAKRARKHAPAAFARIEGKVATFEVTATDEAAKVIAADGRVVDGTRTVRKIRGLGA